MFRSSRRQIILASFIIPLLAVGGWIYARRPQPVVIASYVPESALGYLEINNWPQLLDSFTSTNAWRQLAPVYGVSNKLDYIGKVSQWDLMAQITGGGEAAMLARAQFAIVVTGLEVRGEEVKPRLALIAETHSNPESLGEVMERRLPELARNIFGQFVKATDRYNGVQVTAYRAENSDKQLVAAQIEGELILANHPDPLRACIDTRLGRAPSMAGNFYLQNARPIVERADCADGGGCMFGFVTGEGVTRLLRFGTFLISGDVLSKAALAGAMGDVFTEFSTRATDGIAYGANFENGVVVDRYALMLKPEVADALKTAIKPNAKALRATDVIPAEAADVTLVGVENPMKTLDGIEAAISARIGAAQSFLLHQFVIGAREAFLGLRANDKAEEAIGDEIANFNTTMESEDRVWLVAPRDRAFVTTLVERVFTAQGAVLAREKYEGVEIVSSSDGRRGAAAFVGDFLAIGKRERLVSLIDSHQRGQSIKSAPRFVAASRVSPPAAVRSFTSVKNESGEMMAVIARWIVTESATAPGGSPPAPANVAALNQLPFAASATSVNDRGIYVEARSPFGNFPFFVSIFAGATNGK
ncbi:MAG: DUF3352 domain-containing protein [Blastocatellia bacterium]